MKFRLSLASTFFAAAIWLAAASVARAQAPAADAGALQRQVNVLAASFPGKVGVYIRNVETGATVTINPDATYPMASTYKIPIMLQVFREVEAGKISLTERYTLKTSDQRPGSGLFHYFTPGISPTIHDLLLLMIVVSDNEATDILLNRVGAANVTATVRQLGIKDLRVDRTTEQIIGDWLAAADSQFKGKNAAAILARPDAESHLTKEQMDHAADILTADPQDHSSPRAMGELLEKIIKNEAASKASCEDLLGIMQKQEHRGRISRYMEDRITATKSGTIGATTNDVGVLYVGNQHIVITVYTVKSNANVPTALAEELIGRIAETTYNYFDAQSAAH